jgi:glycosyltransferase involved in cell wall biosynthesis
MEKLPISVFFVTLNESAYIAKAIKSVDSCDEIIVVDCGSTDGTQEIATSLGANVVYHPWQGYAKQKQFALELCKNEWVLNLDGDEVMTENALKELEGVINNPSYSSFRLKRIDMFINKFPKESVKKKNNLRAYRKSLAFFNEQKLEPVDLWCT